MRLIKFISKPIISYIRAGKLYPNFWGETHTHPNLISLHGANILCVVYCFYKGTAYYFVDKKDIAYAKRTLFKKLLSKPDHDSYCLAKTQEVILECESYFQTQISKLKKCSNALFGWLNGTILELYNKLGLRFKIINVYI